MEVVAFEPPILYHHATKWAHRPSALNASPKPMHSRREVISDHVSSALMSWCLSSATPAGASTTTGVYRKRLPFSTTLQIIQYLRRNCNQRYLQSVQASGYNFLYRGEEVSFSEKDSAAYIINEPPDLLDPMTYQSTEASSYFQVLEHELTARGSSVKPSNGHLATTCPIEATRWGTAVSIWPLGESNVEFAWLKEGGVFWPPEGSVRSDSTIITTTTKQREMVFGFDSGLEGALRGDAWEIMFRADNGFRVVSAELDIAMKHLL